MASADAEPEFHCWCQGNDSGGHGPPYNRLHRTDDNLLLKLRSHDGRPYSRAVSYQVYGEGFYSFRYIALLDEQGMPLR